MLVEIISLESEKSQSRLAKRLADTPFSFSFLNLQNVIENKPQLNGGRVLYASAGRLNELVSLIEESDLLFDLLICNSQRVFSYRALMSRCTTILVLPVDEATLVEALTETVTQHEEDDSLLALTMNFVGDSAPVRDLLKVVDRVARYDAPILIHGETGTGKELVARGIHYESMRKDSPFVPVNCGALTDDLLLSELFGYEPGAFTDAKKQHVGLVTQASQGTLFLDEVDSLSGKAQASLLRFMQDQEYRPLGSELVLRSDVRIICATNRNLESMVEQGLFREDLYYRLKILDVKTPPLRERRDDIPILIEFFLNEIAHKYNEPIKILHPLTERWMVHDYNWPGNVRELENYLHRLIVLSRGRSIYVPDILGMPLDVRTRAQENSQIQESEIGSFQEAKALQISQFEKLYLSDLMKRTSGNVSQAAKISGKERRALGRLLKKHDINCVEYKKPAVEHS